MTKQANRAGDMVVGADIVVDAPWSRPPDEVLAAVTSRRTGLTAEEAEQRLERVVRQDADVALRGAGQDLGGLAAPHLSLDRDQLDVQLRHV